MNIPTFKHGRPTIGVLAGWSGRESQVPDYYLSSVLRGIQSSAQKNGCHLLVAWGAGRFTEADGVYPAWPLLSPEVDFVPVGPWNTDALIVFSPLRSESLSAYIQKLIAGGHPVLFIAPGEKGPTISVDNKTGIRQAVEHLKEHGHRQLAFIAGSPNDSGDSADRLAAYKAVMAERKLPLDPRLIVPGWHTVPGGYHAMQELLASGVRFTAVLASNDNSAVGALQAIQEAGLRVPEDIALIGFDDQPDVVAQRPPLASVHIPLAVIGEHALGMLYDHLTRQVPLESVRLPTRLVRRRSCGCLSRSVTSASDLVIQAAPARQSGPSAVRFADAKLELVNDMLAVLPAELRFPGGERYQTACAHIVDAFFKSLQEDDPLFFQKTLLDLPNSIVEAGGAIGPWQEMISVLRSEMYRVPIDWSVPNAAQLSETLLHQARTAISECAEWEDQYHNYQRDVAARSISKLTAHLSCLLESAAAVRFLDEHIAGLGIRHARVMVFEPDPTDPVAGSLVLNDPVAPDSQRFPSRQFPPDGLYPPEELLNLALLPLVFQDEPLGYVAFDAAPLETASQIAAQLSATLKASALAAQARPPVG